MNILSSLQLQRKLIVFKAISIIFSIGALWFIVYVKRATAWLDITWKQKWTEFFSFKPYEAAVFTKKWGKTKKRLEKGWESEAKLAIIEADNLFDTTLKKMGYRGESLGERLKQLDENVLVNIEDVWEAHKIRNDIVHDPNYSFSIRKARLALDIYEQALKNLEVL